MMPWACARRVEAVGAGDFGFHHGDVCHDFKAHNFTSHWASWEHIPWIHGATQVASVQHNLGDVKYSLP